ncbi:MAG: DUF4411 family protein [Candidatus Thorarchaeota archaeon]|nr:DUF4411 family protein [Candidatus Thorarchaeota archaeon]
MAGVIYVIDASSIVELFIRYPVDKRHFQVIWQSTNNLVISEQLMSHYEVYRELTEHQTQVSIWCKQHRGLFIELDSDQINLLPDVQAQYDPEYWRRNQLQTGPWADPWIIVLAILLRIRMKSIDETIDVKIVTEENPTKTNNIPKIANHFGIQSLKILDLFDEIC